MWKYIKRELLLDVLMREKGKLEVDVVKVSRLFLATDDEYNWPTWSIVNNRLKSVTKAIAKINRLYFDYKYKKL